MTDHSFNPFIAEKYSIHEAIFINNMIFWTRINASNQSNYHDGRYWTYGTPKFYSRYFPYFTSRQMKDVINKCLKNGLIIKGNYNKKGFDRTNWYALSDKALFELNLDKTCLKPRQASLDEIRPMHWTESVQPIPDTKPDNNNIISHTSEKRKKSIDNKTEKKEPEKKKEPDLTKEKKESSQLVASSSDEAVKTKKINLKAYVDKWNELAGKIGCPLVGDNKRQRETIKRHLRRISQLWEQELTPDNFAVWLEGAIYADFYLITKYLNRMDICLRWEHFEKAYQETLKLG